MSTSRKWPPPKKPRSRPAAAPLRPRTLAEQVAALGWRLVHQGGHCRAEREGYASVRATTPGGLLEKLAYANAYREKRKPHTSAPPEKPVEEDDGSVAA